MLLALLVATTTVNAQPREQRPVAAQQATWTPEALVAAHSIGAAFDTLTTHTVTAGFGRTARVYGHKSGIRTAHPIAVVRTDPSGSARLLTTFRGRPLHENLPALGASELESRLPSRLASPEVGPVRWWPVGDRLVAARAVWSETSFRGVEHPVLLVDARSGRMLDLAEGIAHLSGSDKPASAHIYATDPVLTPEVDTVELPRSTHRGLVSPHFTVLNCLDRGTTYSTNSDLGEVDLRHCEGARPDTPEGAQWLFDPDPYPLDPARDEDAFAGPHLLWHGEVTLRAFTELGLPLAERPDIWRHLEAHTNRRTTDLYDETSMSDPDAPLVPYDNAFFRRGRERSDGSRTNPQVVFGQGTVADFAYDADVIIHELGHFAVWTQTGPSSARSSEHGSTAEPGALNEGLADYFTAVRTGDPEVGTYTGESLGRPYIRTLDGTARCPDALYGQTHADSQPFSQALWTARSRLSAADQPRFDQAVMDALPSIGPEGGFSDATQAIEAEVALQLGSTSAELVAGAFTDRAVDACEPLLPVESGFEARSFSQVPAYYADLYDQPIPGYVQFVIDEDGPLDVILEFEQTQSFDVDLWGTLDPADVEVLHGAGAPITHTPFTDDDLERYVWDHDGTVVATATRQEEVGTSIDGREVDHLYRATFTVRGPGPHYIQLANLAERTVTARDVVLSWSPGDPLDDTGAPALDAAPPQDKSGCGCGQGPTGPFSWAALPLLALVVRRRTPSS